MSDELKKYIKKNKRYKLMIVFTQIFILFLFIFLWQILADKNIINSFITSSPKNIVKTLINVYENNNLLYHIWITVKETTISFIITSVLSIILAIMLYNFKFLSLFHSAKSFTLNISPLLLIISQITATGFVPHNFAICTLNSVCPIRSSNKEGFALSVNK